MSVSKALESATNYATRWTSERVERRLDDRDVLLSEVLYNLENRSVTLSGDATGTGTVDSSGDLDIAVSLASSSFAGLASTGDLDVDGDTTMGGDLTFDSTVSQSITGPVTASLSVSPGATSVYSYLREYGGDEWPQHGVFQSKSCRAALEHRGDLRRHCRIGHCP